MCNVNVIAIETQRRLVNPCDSSCLHPVGNSTTLCLGANMDPNAWQHHYRWAAAAQAAQAVPNRLSFPQALQTGACNVALFYLNLRVWQCTQTSCFVEI